MTKERRLENQKKVKELAEKQKIAVRNIRQEHLKLTKNVVKDDPGIGKDEVTRAEKDIEKKVKSAVDDIDRITEQVRKDIMEA